MRLTGIIILIILPIGIAVTLPLIVWQNPSRGQTLIEITSIFLSWPAVIGALGLTFGITFRKELSDFINRLGTIRLPGGTEISSSPPQPAPETKSKYKKEEGNITLSIEQQEPIRKHIEDLKEKIAGSECEKEELFKVATDLLLEKQGEVVYWWFEYLSLFLVPHTQLVSK